MSQINCSIIKIFCPFFSYCQEDVLEFKHICREIQSLLSVNYNFLVFQIYPPKKIYKIDNVSVSRLKATVRQYEQQNYEVFAYQNTRKTIYRQTQKSQMSFIVLVAKSKKDIYRYLMLDLDENYMWMCGYLLGYPQCCIQSYKKNLRGLGDIHYDFRWRQKIFGDRGYICPLINRWINLFGYIPCSSDCHTTILLAQKILQYVRKTLGEKAVRAYFYVIKKGLLKDCGLDEGNRFYRSIPSLLKNVSL